jgi:hypothetical protein
MMTAVTAMLQRPQQRRQLLLRHLGSSLLGRLAAI